LMLILLGNFLRTKTMRQCIEVHQRNQQYVYNTGGDEQMEVNNHDIGALTTFSKCRYK